MNKYIYNRQSLLQLTHIPVATIVGVGGTGSLVALLLAMSGCEELYLMDGDFTEETNFNRLLVPPMKENMGVLKTEIVSRMIQPLRPDCRIHQLGQATPFSLSETEGVIFDCTDNVPTQNLVYEFSKDNKRGYVRDGYDGTHITVLDRASSWQGLGVQQEGYTVFPSWVVPAMLAACIGVAKVMYNPNINVTGDISKIMFSKEEPK